MMRRRYSNMSIVERTYEIPDDLIRPDPKSILMLEDDASLADVLRKGLEHNNYIVTRVRSGAEGVQCILKQDYDFLLCDMIMPGFPGDMFYRAVERVRPHLCRRFLFMTGHNGDAQIDAFIRSVRGLMIWKPFQLHELLQALKVVAEKNASGATI
ncbi:MAG: response regulator [Verrucomicrobia bacterium]|nr:response regulator [Verrucomicrobiota bacterium]